MPLNSRLSHRSWWLAISILMPRVLFCRRSSASWIYEVPLQCHLHTQLRRADCSNVPDPLTGLSYPARLKLAEGVYTVTLMLPITTLFHLRSRFPDDQEQARPCALTALSLGPKARAYRRNTWPQAFQIRIESDHENASDCGRSSGRIGPAV